ncbi:PP2C family protein-serine/threonine phosphatase [Gemmobacter nectariphilus]|uniref:PP2C family protein-serine/threonine phosphatase n=1 Tax=Gemmobacter nectariphilus TaxID=220343 RepID=UPI000483E9CF|nr:SpoIIE family protein phosphatase [Gemmobacter nectariphilus]
MTARQRVLVVDDSRAQRALLRVSLTRWGYEVTEAATGDEALALCRVQQFDIVLSDWMMPGLSGPDFCRAYRALPGESYGYFILLTSKSEKDEVALGLDAGADDFLSKPVTPEELRARMRAGERLLAMQRELRDNNRLLGAALDELQGVYDSLDRDLIEARKLQQSLVRDRHHDFGSAAISLLLRPSGHVGGDLVGYFPLAPDRLAFFSVDVSGHGVASAMMAARLAGLLSASFADGNVVFDYDSGAIRVLPPEQVAERLNHLVLEVMQVDQYFTCVYGDADLRSGRLRMVQAGHPHPLLLDAAGDVRPLGGGGLPVGLIPGARWDRLEITLAPGDRLFLMTDGLTECRNPMGEELGEDGLARLVRRNLALGGEEFLDALQWDVEAWAGSADLADDMSGVLLDWRGLAQ